VSSTSWWWFRERLEQTVLRGEVYDERKRTENRALGNTTGGGIQEPEIITTFNAEGVRR